MSCSRTQLSVSSEYPLYRPESSVGRTSAFGVGGCGFESRSHHTKGVKNGTSSSLADARIKWVVLGR